MCMYKNNMRLLREKNKLTQQNLSKQLSCNQNIYSYWEAGKVPLPIHIADKLALFYHCSLAYLLCEEQNYKYEVLKAVSYDIILKNLLYYKAIHNYTYKEIADNLECARSTVGAYFNGRIKMNCDTLILLSRFFEVDIDILCGKR